MDIPNDKKYTLQEVRSIIQDHSDDMNVYKFLDAAVGIEEVQSLLSKKQDSDRLDGEINA